MKGLRSLLRLEEKTVEVDPYEEDERRENEEALEHEALLPPHTGRPDEAPADFERRRVASLPLATPPVPTLPGHRSLPTSLEIKLAVVPVVREAMGGIRQILDEQAEAMKLLDIPLEQVKDAHERASSSFENLRAEIADVSARLGAVEGVIDTAGLMRAHGESAELLKSIAKEVRSQLTLTRTTLERVVETLSVINADAIESNRRALRKAQRKRKK